MQMSSMPTMKQMSIIDLRYVVMMNMKQKYVHSIKDLNLFIVNEKRWAVVGPTGIFSLKKVRYLYFTVHI
jgi:ABC-type molybdenum transport system ATPase subunit/photorepair protein PhrA